MKMFLKNNENKKIDIFTKKNYKIFLISLFVLSIIIGIFFFIYMNSSDKEIVTNNLKEYFTIKDNYSYLRMFFEALKDNFFLIITFWLLGISIIGILYNLFLFFVEGFSLGFTLAGIFYLYKIKGIFATIIYLFPSKLIYFLIIFILTYFSIKFSYYLFNYIFLKKEIDFQKKLKSYTKKLVICIILGFIFCLLDIFINPLIIKAFTFLL